MPWVPEKAGTLLPKPKVPGHDYSLIPLTRERIHRFNLSNITLSDFSVARKDLVAHKVSLLVLLQALLTQAVILPY